MRFHLVVAAALLLSLSVPASAQEWTQYVSKEDRFTGNFPGQPTVTQTTYSSQYDAELPARVYSARRGNGRYSMTVVDYGPWRLDFHGAIVYATWRFLQRDAKVTELAWNTTGSVGGNQIHLTNRDGSRTMAAVYMHTQKLYIIEGTVPKGEPAPPRGDPPGEIRN